MNGTLAQFRVLSMRLRWRYDDRCMGTKLRHELEAFLGNRHLPAGLADEVETYYLPLVDRLADRKGTAMLVFGINGAQGTGKSTLATLFKWMCEQRHGWTAAVLSLDDLYLGQQSRRVLAESVHPLLAIRGVPGTHDVALGLKTVGHLARLKAGESVRLPRFDKSIDEPLPVSCWEQVSGPVDMLIIEGWCLASPPQAEVDLACPCNALEAREDSQGVWRRWVNHQLADVYPPLFALVDVLLYLKAPDMDAVFRWRMQQERELAASSPHTPYLMTAAQIEYFVSLFERLTRHQMEHLSAIADVTFELNAAHAIRSFHAATLEAH